MNAAADCCRLAGLSSIGWPEHLHARDTSSRPHASKRLRACALYMYCTALITCEPVCMCMREYHACAVRHVWDLSRGRKINGWRCILDFVGSQSVVCVLMFVFLCVQVYAHVFVGVYVYLRLMFAWTGARLLVLFTCCSMCVTERA